jgi:GR25 family glycosyltransferase involved in LPS biosynthesis
MMDIKTLSINYIKILSINYIKIINTMDFNTYVINLDKDKCKYDKLSSSLNAKRIKHMRFSAIYGKNINNQYDEHIVSYKNFIPKNILGCGLSHFFVCRDHFKKTDAPALIFEDDAVLLFKDKDDINNVIDSAPHDWDIILLCSYGITNYKSKSWNTNRFSGSTIAYIINKKGYNKWLGDDFKVDGHIDWNRMNKYAKDKNFKVYKTPVAIVEPDSSNISSTSTNYSQYTQTFDKIIDHIFYDKYETGITGFRASQCIKYKSIRIPYIDIELDSTQIFIIIMILALYVIFIAPKLT